jgi:hypothetical protein
VADPDKVELSLQKKFEYETLRRVVRQAKDAEMLRRESLKLIDFMEAQQLQVMRMLQQKWLGD